MSEIGPIQSEILPTVDTDAIAFDVGALADEDLLRFTCAADDYLSEISKSNGGTGLSRDTTIQEIAEKMFYDPQYRFAITSIFGLA